jgi:molybdopterin-containing oxidoreductase family iron-sulfur binding subunit
MPCKRPPPDAAPVDRGRRRFLKGLAGLGLTSTAVGLLPGCDRSGKFGLPRHFQQLSDEEIADLLADLQRRYRERTGRDFRVAADPPLDQVVFGYGLDLSRCIGCRRCVYACVEENNQSRDPQIHWIRVLEMDKAGGIELVHADQYYDPPEVPQEDKFYMPVACQQCKNPPCTKVCPVKATWTDPDGIVVIDYDWCIGCRYCMAACPYGARHFNWAEPEIATGEWNTDTHVLGNRPRPKGVVEKCTFCIQRVRRGRYPACVEVCPVGARKFGNLLDPADEMRYILEHKRVLLLKEELNTQPRFFYFYGT